jgi:CDGSH-type Zn-finger protein
MSDKAKIADNKPVVLEIEPGTYYWCSCGQSKNQPYCDGSHSGTGFSPKEFTVAEKKKVALCTCKQTGNSPFCDGKHKGLTPD